MRDALADLDGIDEAFIFGSWATPGVAAPQDVDLMVIGEPDIGQLYEAVSTVDSQVDRPINVSVRSKAEWESADGGFERTVKEPTKGCVGMSDLDDLIAKRLIEPVEIDELTGPQWIEDARRHLQAAQAVESIDPAGAYILAYDTARKSVAAVLLMTGHRVTSRPGSRQALALFAKTLAEDAHEPALAHVDRLRRNRNRSEYGSTTFASAEVKEAIQIAGAILDACSKRI